jgi:hypothetical protein
MERQDWLKKAPAHRSPRAQQTYQARKGWSLDPSGSGCGCISLPSRGPGLTQMPTLSGTAGDSWPPAGRIQAMAQTEDGSMQSLS